MSKKPVGGRARRGHEYVIEEAKEPEVRNAVLRLSPDASAKVVQSTAYKNFVADMRDLVESWSPKDSFPATQMLKTTSDIFDVLNRFCRQVDPGHQPIVFNFPFLRHAQAGDAYSKAIVDANVKCYDDMLGWDRQRIAELIKQNVILNKMVEDHISYEEELQERLVGFAKLARESQNAQAAIEARFGTVVERYGEIQKFYETVVEVQNLISTDLAAIKKHIGIEVRDGHAVIDGRAAGIVSVETPEQEVRLKPKQKKQISRGKQKDRDANRSPSRKSRP